MAYEQVRKCRIIDSERNLVLKMLPCTTYPILAGDSVESVPVDLKLELRPD